MRNWNQSKDFQWQAAIIIAALSMMMALVINVNFMFCAIIFFLLH